MKSIRFSVLLMCLVIWPLYAQNPEPPVRADSWRAAVENGKELRVTLTLPKKIYVYADAAKIELSDKKAQIAAPESTLRDGVRVYGGPGEFVWRVKNADALAFPLEVAVEWQACSEDGACFLPGTAVVALFDSKKDFADGVFRLPGGPEPEPDAAPETPELKNILSVPDYTIVRSASGYLPPRDFIAFLSGDSAASPDLAKYGAAMLILIVLLGGLALNLTPCVLPLIPVNLAMIGAGRDSVRSVRDRLLRGTFYGAGIALTYGLLGVIAVVTGSTFGSLAGNWMFNAAAALVFLALGLAMFDVFQLDFSRFGNQLKMPRGAHFAGVFLMGCLSAVLAGACVAPVVVAVLIQSAGLVAGGQNWGFALPFLLGIGMALPWPFAAAGLALFPKPGAWMDKVKHVLGVLIFLLAAYYAWTAATLIRTPSSASPVPADGAGMEKIASALEKARADGGRVLLDFGASWCKNCTAMEHGTLTDAEVRDFIKTNQIVMVKIQAEDPSEPRTRLLLDRFGVRGLPHFVLLDPVRVRK